MNAKAINDFGTGSVSRHILSQAIPLTIAQLVQILYNITDRIYIGHLPGTSGMALTGIGLIFPIVTLIAAFTTLFGQGGGSLCSIARGAGDIKRAERIMTNTFVMLVISGVILTALCYIFKTPVLYALGASDNTFGYANDYLNIYLIGTLFTMLSLGMNWFINSMGFARFGMITVLSGAVLNIVLDPLFIFVFGLGIKGAAIATVIAQLGSMLWVLSFLFGKKTILHIRKEYLKPDKRELQNILALGLAGFIMNGTNCLVQVVCNVALSAYGDVYIGIMTVINSIREIASLPVSGIAHAAQPVMGYNYGARLYGRVKDCIRFTLVSGTVVSLIFWVCVMIFPRFFMSLFTSEPDILDMGQHAMRLYYAAFFTMILQFTGQSTFTAIGYAKPAIFFSLFRKAILVVPLTLILPHFFGLGAYGVFAAEPISNVIGGTACFVTMIHIVWQRLGK